MTRNIPSIKTVCCLYSDKRKRRDCDSPVADFRSFITHSFLLKGEKPPVCIGCDELLTIEHNLLNCSDLIEIRESHFTAQSLCVLFQEISPETIFNFLKEINNFGKFNNLRSLLVMLLS